MIKSLSRNNLFLYKFLTIFFWAVFYFALTWGIHLILISVFSFIHFSMDHNLRTIEEWVFDRAWLISILAKVGGFYLIYYLHKRVLGFSSNIKIQRKPGRDILVVSAFVCISMLLICSPSIRENYIFDFPKIFYLLIISPLFYCLDLVVLRMISSRFEDDKVGRWIEIVLYTVLSFIFLKYTFIYFSNVGHIYFFHLLLLLIVDHYSRNNFVNVLFCAFTVIAFSGFILGQDIVWGSLVSPFANNKQFTISTSIVIFLVATLYLKIVHRKLGD